MDKSIDLSEWIKEYEGAVIKDFKNRESNPGVIYASIYNGKGELMVSATLDYCAKRIEEIMKIKETSNNYGKL